MTGDRTIFHLMIHSPRGLNNHTKSIQSQEPEASSQSPTLLQDYKSLGRPLLLSQVITRELDEKWSCKDMNRTWNLMHGKVRIEPLSP